MLIRFCYGYECGFGFRHAGMHGSESSSAASPKTIPKHSKHISKPVLEEAGDVSISYENGIKIEPTSYPNCTEIVSTS